MPQASTKLRQMFEDDSAAFDVIDELFAVDKAGIIRQKSTTNIYAVPDEVWAAISYLCDEWDYSYLSSDAVEQ